MILIDDFYDVFRDRRDRDGEKKLRLGQFNFWLPGHDCITFENITVCGRFGRL